MLTDSISPGTAKTEAEHRRDLCTAGRWIHRRGYVASTDGNVSVRLDADRILTSPTGVSKGLMSPEDMVIVVPHGRKLAGDREPSSELAMHLLIYSRRPEVNAVCHAHPPIATAHAAAGIPLDKALICELVIDLGSIPIARYGTPGTSELCEGLEPFVQNHDAILMANHGAVTCGRDLLTAFFRMETVEHFAQVSLITGLLGRQVLLSGKEVEKLIAARTRYGLPEKPAHSEWPMTQETAPKSNGHDSVTLTRGELEALIEEALRKDRATR